MDDDIQQKNNTVNGNLKYKFKLRISIYFFQQDDTKNKKAPNIDEKKLKTNSSFPNFNTDYLCTKTVTISERKYGN